MSGRSWTPGESGGQLECSEVVAGIAVVAGGYSYSSPVFELAEASLDGVAPLVAGLVESDRAATS